MKFCVYEKALLPKNFQYPKLYLELSMGKATLDQETRGAWCFIDASSELGKLQYKLRQKKGLNLIPFARLFDWAAFFDGDDSNGDPKIHIFDLGDMEHHIILKNFDEWLRSLNDF